LFVSLRTNRNSKVFFRKGYRDKLDIANVLGIPLGSLPIKYLGLPLFISYPKPRHFSSLIEKRRTRIDGWMVKSLSAAGRAELIRSVLHNILAYWVGSFKLLGLLLRSLRDNLLIFSGTIGCMHGAGRISMGLKLREVLV